MLTHVLFWIGASVYVILVVSMVFIVLLENRQPEKTIAWVVAIVLLPVIGPIAFIFFGQTIKRTRYINRHRYFQITSSMLQRDLRERRLNLPKKYAQLIELNENSSWAFLADNNKVELLTSGNTFLQALLRAIYQARHHIHIETYIIEDDAVGHLVRDALIDKVKEGVTVRLMYDDVGCWNVSDRFFRTMTDAGIEVLPFMPVRFPSLSHKINYRNHRKIIVIDGNIGFIGGMNLALRYVSTRERVWRDMQLQVRGNVVGRLQRIFLVDWQFLRGEEQEMQMNGLFTSPQPVPQNSALMQIVSSYPVSPYPEIMFALCHAINLATRYVYVQTPYFMPTEPVIQALQTAALAGIDVRVMIPMKPDGIMLRWANDSYVEDLLKAGVKVYMMTDGFLHSKTMVIDDDWCSVGSANMDFRSFDNNFEANALIYDEACAKKVRKVFENDMTHCNEIELEEWNKRPMRRKIQESLTRLFSPLF